MNVPLNFFWGKNKCLRKKSRYTGSGYNTSLTTRSVPKKPDSYPKKSDPDPVFDLYVLIFIGT